MGEKDSLSEKKKKWGGVFFFFLEQYIYLGAKPTFIKINEGVEKEVKNRLSVF